MKAGSYYVGDIAYVFTEGWQAFLNTYWDEGEDQVFEYKGQEVFMGGTEFGDGTYRDNHGFTYAVDSGTIGVLPLTLVEAKLGETVRGGFGQIIDFPEDFEPRVVNGEFTFGDIVIDTRN